jgi:hypothetical protein
MQHTKNEFGKYAYFNVECFGCPDTDKYCTRDESVRSRSVRSKRQEDQRDGSGRR